MKTSKLTKGKFNMLKLAYCIYIFASIMITCSLLMLVSEIWTGGLTGMFDSIILIIIAAYLHNKADPEAFNEQIDKGLKQIEER